LNLSDDQDSFNDNFDDDEFNEDYELDGQIEKDNFYNKKIIKYS
jgi:hypothetical protein